MTGRKFKLMLKQRAQQKRKYSENAAAEKKDQAAQEDHYVTESNHCHEEANEEDAQRVDDQREKQTCSSEENETHDANCMGSKQDDRIEGESKDCSICKQEGDLICCAGRGCKRNFHLSCLVPPMTCFPTGPWHCYWCVRRKMKLGVHAVSEGVESLLDARECLCNEVVQKQEYLVKYKGLAHVHNCWSTDEQLCLEAPAALARFKKKHKSVSWKTEWSLPHRLLDKRLFAVTDHNTDVHGIDENDADCHYEWLVKWTGLDYSHATWELENASFLRSPEAVKLMTDYEIRHQQATKELQSLTEYEKREADFPELPTPLFGSAPYISHLSYVKTLLKFWQKGQSAVIIDNQERILKVVLFLLSLPKDVCLPFLIITTSAALPLWEAEFSRWAYANIVVYKGNSDVRAIIRKLEFYNKRGALMFQVLLSHYDAIVEDLEILKQISWEAVIIDQCQGSAMPMLHSQIKVLSADMRLLIFHQDKCHGRFNCCNVLSLLDPKYDKANNELVDTDSDIDLTEFKERFKQFIAYECKSSPSMFIEYWVPVKLSNEQIEQYCACLVSNSAWLCSSRKSDSPSSPYDILVSTRKCCDHPYLEDQSLQDIVMKGVPEGHHFDVELKLSGKLELLNKILQEIKHQGQRVLILFRSLGGSEVISIGGILEEFIYRKFGGESYLSISQNVTRGVKEATLNKFNNKGSGKFVFLMETRACVPTVKLSGIDIIILFNSDWDPNKDLISLQKITVNSQSEHIKVLRLYSCFTVEEKALILAKQGLAIDSNIKNINQAACSKLLTWGASYLFYMLDCFHAKSSVSKWSSEVAALDDVFAELLSLMSSNCENSDHNFSKILKVQKNGGTYPSEISLLGELEMQRMDDSSFARGLLENEPPQVFWTNLLHERVPRWEHSRNPSRGIRRKVRLQGDLYQPSRGEKVSENEGNNVHLTPEPKLNEANDVHLTPEPKLRKKRKLRVQGKRHKLGMSLLSAGNKHKRRRHATNPNPQCDKPAEDNHQSHNNCNISSSQQVLDSMNRPIDSSIQRSTGNWPVQQHASIGALNGASMRSRNYHEDQCYPDASPNTPNLPQSPHLHPLQMKTDSIQKEKEQIMQLHEDVKLLLQSEYEAEVDSIKKKYNLLLQIAERKLAQKQKDIDTKYNLVHKNELLAEAMTQAQDTADTVESLEMTVDGVGRTVTGTRQSSPHRPSSVPEVTASISEPVNSEQRAADPQISSENFPMATIPSPNSELSRVEEPVVVPRTSARATICGWTVTGTRQSSPHRPSSFQDMTASISEPVNSEQRAADPRISSENFPMTAIPSPNAELPRVEEPVVVPRTSARATVCGRTITGTIQSSQHRPSSVPEVTAFTSEPVNSGQQAADPQISSKNFPVAAIPSPNAELPRVEEPAVVPPRTNARATLQTASYADLPTSGSRAIPTANYQSVILTPSQLSTRTLSNATTPGASCEQRKSAPHLRPFRPPPTMNSWNINNGGHNEGDETSHWDDQMRF